MNTELFERMQDLSGIVMILLRTGLLCLVWRLFLPKEADKRVRFIVLAALLTGQLALWFGTQGLLLHFKSRTNVFPISKSPLLI